MNTVNVDYVVQRVMSPKLFDGRLGITNWIGDYEPYTLDVTAQEEGHHLTQQTKPTAPKKVPRLMQQAKPTEAVKIYFRKEEDQCLKKRASKKKASASRLPPCPCISPDLSM